MAMKTVSQSLDGLNVKLGGTVGAIEPSTTKADALKAIYSTLGGTDDVSNISTVSEMVDKVTEVAEAGGGAEIEWAELTIKNNTGKMLYTMWNYRTDGYDNEIITHENVVMNSGSTKTMNIPFASSLPRYIDETIIIRAAASSTDLSTLSVASNTTGLTAAVVGGFKPTYDPADDYWRALVRITGQITAGQITLTL